MWEGLDLRLNVRFRKAVKKLVGSAPNERKMPAPRLLDGLNDVSPLESLAWHRDPYTTPADPFEVSLKNATYDAASNRLVIRSEPVQVSGQSVALLKFIKAEPNGKPREVRLTARHFDKATQSFGGPEITVIAQESSIQPKVGKTENSIPMTTVKGISENPMNEEGWYAYGTLNSDGTYKLESLEPRSVMRVGATQKYIQGKEAALKFFEKQQWDEATIVKEKGTVRKTLVEPAGAADFNSQKELWLKDKGNQRFLVLNLFGWWKWNGQLERDSIIKLGHVALGVAKIVVDPFTGEDRFEIEYKQVYGANNEDIAAGSMTWAHYMGNLERGWMYTRPISDILVRFPEFSRSYQGVAKPRHMV